jgi:hypothetical protein
MYGVALLSPDEDFRVGTYANVNVTVSPLGRFSWYFSWYDVVPSRKVKEVLPVPVCPLLTRGWFGDAANSPGDDTGGLTYEPKLNQHIDGSLEVGSAPLAVIQGPVLSVTVAVVLPGLEPVLVAPPAARATWVVTRP